MKKKILFIDDDPTILLISEIIYQAYNSLHSSLGQRQVNGLWS